MGTELTERGIDRVVLTGFMGAGKSTVGSILARRLGWDFIDLDEQISAVARRSIAAIFAEQGESVFREMEATETRRVLQRARLVIAPGGGWVANPGACGELPAGTIRVWLRVDAQEALRRVRACAIQRPLLAGPDPAAAIEQLLARREPLYREAELTVDTGDLSASEVAERIEILLRGRGAAAAPS
jgi:shikimate kinase